MTSKVESQKMIFFIVVSHHFIFFLLIKMHHVYCTLILPSPVISIFVLVILKYRKDPFLYKIRNIIDVITFEALSFLTHSRIILQYFLICVTFSLTFNSIQSHVNKITQDYLNESDCSSNIELIIPYNVVLLHTFNFMSSSSMTSTILTCCLTTGGQLYVYYFLKSERKKRR